MNEFGLGFPKYARNIRLLFPNDPFIIPAEEDME